MGLEVGGDRQSSPWKASFLAGNVGVHFVPAIVADHIEVPAPGIQDEDHPSVLFLKADTFPNAGWRDWVGKCLVPEQNEQVEDE